MILALTGVQIAFATWSIVGKVTVAVVPPFALIALRLAGGAAFFAVLGRAMGIALVPPREVRREVALLAISGLVFNQIFFTVGLKYTGAIESSVLGSTIPIFTVAYAVLSKREQGHRWLWRGLALAMLGALTVSRPQRLTLRDDHLFGNLLILINSAAYSVYLVRGRLVMAKYGAHTVITWMFWMAALMVLPLGIPSVIATAGHWPFRAWLAIAYVIAMPTAFAYGANAFALARAPSSVVAVFIYLQPVLTVALAITCGDPLARWLGVAPPHEHMTVQLGIGMACGLLGVFLAARGTAATRAPLPASPDGQESGSSSVKS